MWPTPKEFLSDSEAVWLSPDVKVKLLANPVTDISTLWISGAGNPLPKTSYTLPLALSTSPENEILSAFERFKTAVFKEQLFVPEKFYPRTTTFEPDLSLPKTVVEEILLESLTKESAIYAPEAYILKVSKANITIQASSYLGFLHGFTTLQQLFYNHSQSIHEAYTYSSPLTIHDAPSFSHRGLNLDISRNRIYPQDVLRTLSAMSLCKLNRLHLHATDSQSWPLDIPSIPSLASKGAYSPSQIWTAADLLAVQQFGQSRGIEVHLEIDMPGHMGAVWHSHPDLTVAYGQQWDRYAVEPPAGQLKLANSDVTAFVAKVLDDVLPRTQPFSPLFHLGMDELNLHPYELEPGLETSDKATLQPYLRKFLADVFDKLREHGRTPVAWEEIVLDWEDLSVPPDTVVQTWRSGEALTKVLEKGFRALFGAATHWYLDTGLGTFLDPDPARDVNADNSNTDGNGGGTGAGGGTAVLDDGRSPIRPPYHDWIPPFKNFRLMLSYDPLSGVPEHLRERVLGGEAHLWGELTDSVSLDGMLWPRAAAAAEVLWAGKGKVGEDSTRRLAEWRERVVLAGVRAGVVQMEWILRNKGGGLL